MLNCPALFEPFAICNSRLWLQRQGDPSASKNLTDHFQCIDHLRKANERGSLVQGLAHLYGRDAYVEGRIRMWLDLWQGLIGGEHDKRDQLSGFVVKVADRVDIAIREVS